jgi:hypothetical protein
VDPPDGPPPHLRQARDAKPSDAAWEPVSDGETVGDASGSSVSASETGHRAIHLYVIGRMREREAENTLYDAWVRVTGNGDSSIDITKIEPLRDPTEPEPEPGEALASAPPPRVGPPRKSATTNHIGFFAGPIHFPVPNARPVTVGRGSHGLGFTLPFRALVSCASVYVVSRVQGSILLVELWDATGKRLCSAPLDVGKEGVMSVLFDPAVPLSPGDYELRWSGERLGAPVQLLGINYHQTQLELINGGGGERPATPDAPLVYFKA